MVLFVAPLAADELELDGLIKAGLEVDTNPHRLSDEGSDTDIVDRLFLELSLRNTSSRQSLSGVVRLGGKRFHGASQENALVTDASAQLTHWLAQPVAAYAYLGLRDRSERGSVRDYLRISSQFGLTLRVGTVSLRAGPSLGFFLYKPDDDLSHAALGATTTLSWAALEELELTLRYRFATRTHHQTQVVSSDDGLTLVPEVQRIDDHHTLGVAVNLEWTFVSALEFFWQRNLSNSFGKGYDRLIGRAAATFALPWEFYFTGQVSVQRTLFVDAIRLDASLAIDDENRNSFAATLGRDLTPWLRAELRYNLYAQEFGNNDRLYERHLGYFGLVGVFGD